MRSQRVFISYSHDSPKHRAPRPRRSLPIEYDYVYRFTEYEYDFEAFDGGVQREVSKIPKNTSRGQFPDTPFVLISIQATSDPEYPCQKSGN